DMDDNNDLFSAVVKTARERQAAVDQTRVEPAATPVAPPVKIAPVAAAKAPARAAPDSSGGYNAAQIQVLDGLEPVRRRPGMY
ncbi:hypothetical protein, partial [Enterobacter hormaechei]|uniref:hypothetical protein n=1 Tax=Enterobacter hormaechei TaxID=158836 RepID=UPI001952CF41